MFYGHIFTNYNITKEYIMSNPSCKFEDFLKTHPYYQNKFGHSFTFSDSWFHFSPGFKRFVLSLIVAFVMVLVARRKFDKLFFVLLATLTLMLYIIFSSMSGTGLGLSMPAATYPPPPHLGLYGVSLETAASY